MNMGQDELGCTNCEAKKDHGVIKLEIKMLNGKISHLEEGVDANMQAIETARITNTTEFHTQLKEVRDYFNNSIEKLKADIKTLFSEQRQLRESVIEIKNAVERASDRTALKVDSLERSIAELLSEKRDIKTTFANPLVVAVIVLILGFVLGKYIK
jgi:outer membrane murein-binding lipoprotein Lpp